MSSGNGSHVHGDVLLVGSMPFETSEEVFRAAGEGLRGHAASLPDGEVGVRTNWVGMLPVLVFDGHPQLEVVTPPPTEGMQQPEGDERPPDEQEGYWTFRVKDGVDDLRFDDLHYARFAKESYETFKRLRDEGAIDSDVRFQLCLPAPNSAIMAFFEDADQWPQVESAYMGRLREEIKDVLTTIPADDLAIQFDLAWEVVDLAMGDRNFFKFWPKRSVEEKFQRHVQWIGELSDAVPDKALLGYHWCYGTWGGWPMTEMKDLSLCVRLANETVKRANRRVDYIHMPVTKDADDAFFAPLADLDVGDTKIFLGMIHDDDGVEGFRRRKELAEKYLSDFGVAGVCGYGRIDPKDVPEVLAVHTACAREL